jgi:hypothetical protein
MPRKIFGSKMEKIIIGWRKFQYEELHNVETLMRGRHVEFHCKSQEESDHCEAIDVYGRIILS